MKLRQLAVVMWAMGLVLPSWAAEPFRYGVDIEAPSDMRALLNQHLDIVRSQTSQRMTEEQLVRLIEATPTEVSSLLETEGYFSPQVKVDYQKRSDVSQVRLQVEPGSPVRITKVDLKIGGAISAMPQELASLRARILESWPLPEGAVFRQEAWDAAKRRSQNLLQDKKYAAAKITESEARIDPAAQTAELTLVLDSGAAYRFGAVEIKGLERYPDSLIRNQARFMLGSDFQRDQLIDLQSSLHDLPHFSLVVVDTPVTEDPPYEVPVRIDVREAPRHKVTAGLGYSTDTGYETSLGYRYLNLADRGWISESKLRLEQYEQAAETSVTFPPQSSDYQHRVHLGYLRSDVEGLLSHTWRTGIARQREEFKFTRIWSAEYLTERREYADGTEETPKTLALNFHWLRRDVDNVRDPRRGQLVQFEVGGAYDKLLSDATFLRLYGRSVRYWPMGRQGVLILRGELGQTFSHEETSVPTDYLFRAGGAGSVRGYDYQSLGVEASGSVTPGRVMATASLEYQLPVWRDWRAAAFVDHGGAADRWQDVSTVTGAGLGARWVSPAGVLGLDVARGIDKQQWRLHIALGLAF